MRHPHHYKISIALAIAAGAWGIYWLPQRILEDGGLTGGWGTISQMVIGFLLLLPIAIWRAVKGKNTGFELHLGSSWRRLCLLCFKFPFNRCCSCIFFFICHLYGQLFLRLCF